MKAPPATTDDQGQFAPAHGSISLEAALKRGMERGAREREAMDEAWRREGRRMAWISIALNSATAALIGWIAWGTWLAWWLLALQVAGMLVGPCAYLRSGAKKSNDKLSDGGGEI